MSFGREIDLVQMDSVLEFFGFDDSDSEDESIWSDVHAYNKRERMPLRLPKRPQSDPNKASRVPWRGWPDLGAPAEPAPEIALGADVRQAQAPCGALAAVSVHLRRVTWRSMSWQSRGARQRQAVLHEALSR